MTLSFGTACSRPGPKRRRLRLWPNRTRLAMHQKRVGLNRSGDPPVAQWCRGVGRKQSVTARRSRREDQPMSLKADLKSLQTRLEAGRPAEVVAAMHRAVEELRASGAA